MWCVERFFTPVDLREDGVGILCPDERLGLLIVMSQVLVDGSFERRHAGEGAAPEARSSDIRKPAFDEIQPGAAGRDEVKVYPRVAGQPSSHRRTLVCTQVVQNQMQRLARRRGPLETPQELDEFLTPVAFADHHTIQDTQRRIQRGRPVPYVVMGLAFGDAGTQRQHGARPVQRLDPTLLIDAKHHGFGGRIQIQPDHVAQLLDQVRVGRQFEAADPVRLEAVLPPNLPNRAVAHPLGLRQAATAPVRAGRWARRQGCFDDRLHLLGVGARKQVFVAALAIVTAEGA